eukprot:gb/GEZN01004835.1/.p1 GENE.gb/GEZN01004835.1/~~gb/GEZN01004835.1/.p1  ORF type:complete len:517 (-),score=86.42 gb/GEZN01004835.1/:302-1852(-)
MFRVGRASALSPRRFSSQVPASEFQSNWSALFRDRAFVDSLAPEATTWLKTHGALMHIQTPSSPSSPSGLLQITHAPISLLPAPIPRPYYQQLQKISPSLNTIMDKVSQDHQFLTTELARSGKADPDFTGKLLGILDKLQKEGSAACPHRVALHRNDFMMQPGKGPLMVEFNTIAASFGSLSSWVAKLHAFLLSRFHTQIALHTSGVVGKCGEVPLNNSLSGIARTLAEATLLHGPNSSVLMVVQPGEKNVTDQRWVEYELWDRFGIPVLRKSLSEIFAGAKLKGAHQDLMMDGHTIGVVYYRAGYTPTDYSSNDEWEAVLRMERSSALTCPSVGYHLAGSKRIQQALSRTGVLESFVSPAEAQDVRNCFARLVALDPTSLKSPDVQTLVAAAREAPEAFVMKPQREGGGNNLWGKQISETLKKGTGLDAYVLMERILPLPSASALVRNEKVTVGPCLSELGIYCGFLYDGNAQSVKYSGQLGHLVRTKQVGVDEGGVATGYSCLDSPLLVDTVGN